MTQRDFARHGAATLLRRAGATLEEVRDLLRHRNVTTTEIYSHVTEELRRVTADRMDQLLGGG